MKKQLLTLVCVATTVAVSAQEGSRSQASSLKPQAPFALTVDNIMRGPELVGNPPNNLRWSGDSKELYFEWLIPKDDQPSTWVVGRDGGEPRRLTEAERRLAPPANGQWDIKRRRILGVDRGDIVIIDTVARKRIDVTRTTGNESSPRWARGETHVTFVRDNNLFIVPVGGDAPTGVITQLTDVSARRADPRVTDSQKMIKEEERKLIDWVEQEAARRKRREELDKSRALPTFELTERQNIADAALTGDDKFVLLVVNDRAQPRTAQVPRYVSESSYTEEIQARTFVGDAQDRRRVATLNLETGEALWAGLDGVSEPIAIPKPPFGDEPRPPAKPEPAAKRDVRWGNLIVSPDGRHIVSSVRAADNTERWFARIDPATGKTTMLDHIKDEAWVRDGGQGWLPDNKRMWFLAEHDGWMHLYTVDVTSPSSRRQLTSGKFEIDAVELSADGTTFYIQSSEQHPGERHIYAMSVDGGARTKLTATIGSHQGAIAPDNTTFGLVSSFANRPPEVFLMPNRPGAAARKITTSPSKEWSAYNWVEPQLITYKSRDGKDVHARLYTPEMVGAKRDPKAPAVVFVHGAGYLQNAHKFWSSYYREYMFHHLLASKGYVVLDPDYRASAGHGRDWRTAIYRWMGGHDLNDVVDGAAYLVKSQKVNAKNIGVYGGSYGGFITLMALFTSPDTFGAGAALRPVTDWAHYNHGYTSNILNEPQTDTEAYRKSSPIYFAEGLKAPLLIAHGMVDVNVHFQDSVRLAQRLIELRKENWELAVYPVEDHGFVEATSWADEYKRILKLFETNLKK